MLTREKFLTPSQKGFTLIEVLLAMAITVIIAVVAYQALDSVMRIVQSQQGHQKQVKALTGLFSVLQRDFQQMIPRKVRHPSGNGFKHALFFNKEAEPMLEFTVGGWDNPIPWRLQRSHLRRVGFHLQDDQLIRYDWPAVDRYEDTEVIKTILYKGVTELKVKFLKTEPKNNAENNNPSSRGKPWKWIERWPESQPDFVVQEDSPEAQVVSQLPLAIEIEMQLENYGHYKRVIKLTEGMNAN